MPGMNSGIDVSDPTVVAAFKAALVHQGLIALLIFALVGLAWVTVRTWTPAAAVPVKTKIPEPMMAPIPSAVSDQGPSVFFSRCSGASASANSLSMLLTLKSCEVTPTAGQRVAKLYPERRYGATVARSVVA